MKKFSSSIFNMAIVEAERSPRERMNINIHEEDSDPLQRMFHVMYHNTYVRPHKHLTPPKRELFMCLKGRIALLEFDDAGDISDYFILDPSSDNYAAEISPGYYHSLLVLDPFAIAFEVKDGPYFPASDKYFAEWSPEEGSPDQDVFLTKLRGDLELLCSNG